MARSESQRQINQLLYTYIALLLSICLIAFLSVAIAGHLLHRFYPFNTCFFQSTSRFGDWTNFIPRVRHLGEPDMLTRGDVGFPYPYPLPSIVLYYQALLFTQHTLIIYLLEGCGIFLLVLILAERSIQRIQTHSIPKLAVTVTILAGFPGWFLIDRGNIEVFIWFFLVLGLLAFFLQKHYLAACLFALAGSMKIYPAILLLLLLPRRQYRAFWIGGLTLLAISILSIWCIGPSMPAALLAVQNAAQYMTEHNIVPLAENNIRFDHSLLALMKQSDYFVQAAFSEPSPEFPEMVRFYGVGAFVSFAALYYFRIRRMPLLNQFIALTFVSVLLPYVSYEYTLVHIYTVFGVLVLFLLQDVASGHSTMHLERMRALIICIALLVSPLSFFPLTYFDGQIKAVVLLAALGLVLSMPMPSSLFGDLEPLKRHVLLREESMGAIHDCQAGHG